MEKIPLLKDFTTFVKGLNEDCTQRKSAIATAVSKIKDKYGQNATEFIASAKKNGVDTIKDFIITTVEPNIDRIQSQEKLQTNDMYSFDYDALLEGLVSWTIVELQLIKNDKSKRTH